MNEKWKEGWESAEKRCGELERNLKSLRELQRLEIGEFEEQKERITKILDDMPVPPRRMAIVNALNEWIDGYTSWYKRVLDMMKEIEMNKKRVNWKLELVLSKNGKKKKIITLDIVAPEKWADNILEVLVLGFEKKGFTVGGGIARVFDE